mgnify:CR=1 FL=1
MKVVQTIKNTYRIDAAKVRMARAQKGWTMTELAERAGVSRCTLRKIERGQGATYTSLEKVAKAFGKRVEDFIEEEGNQ